MLHITAIQINVHDLDLAIDFYCNKLGFEIENRRRYPVQVFLKNNDIRLSLFKVLHPTLHRYPNEAQTLLSIEVEHLTDLMERLRDLGVVLLHDQPQACPVGIFAAFSDPSGNVHELIEYRDMTENSA